MSKTGLERIFYYIRRGMERSGKKYLLWRDTRDKEYSSLIDRCKFILLILDEPFPSSKKASMFG